ncbi:fibronectin type III domain-containing protein [Mucilaginibacter pedocola]|uniref:Fibronectin type-III domain-containing protein n=1 Tax=Mucilaginibacter pedocola TaxID=1792845 RepID=A0A1S9P6A9_9SPHI|nr:fibronectin type III domain-containing protein [Mucilaginibacter pedocola]OOQ56475.1 hypothetical protein BC343_18695 [Mucilaginibacter pedocola]
MKHLTYTAFLFLLALASCGGNKGEEPTPAPKAPVAAQLVFPAQNSTCISGDITSATQSTVTLKWNAAANADSYAIVIKNLLTNETQTLSATAVQVAASLKRNTPYSWYVTSKSGVVTGTADSETWKFYNAGEGISAYAPFPADNLLPGSGASVTVPASGNITLSWKGSDTDNDIAGYDVYFGTTNAPALLKANVSTESVTDVAVTAGIKYYWKVLTRDSKGNTSTSGLVEFTTK